MERLTSCKNECNREMICRYEDCDTCEEYCPHLNEDNCPCLQEVLERLAEYEDIGLLPEQIIEVDRLYAEKCKELAELQKKIKEYRHLEEQRKLLKLPCKEGDTVFKIRDGEILTRIVRGILLRHGEIWGQDGNGSDFGIFGKTVFLTKEEAEATLKEMSESQI